MPKDAKMEAIADGVYAWMAEHPISIGDVIEEGAKKGVLEWLGKNEDKILRAIAESQTEWRSGKASP